MGKAATVIVFAVMVFLRACFSQRHVTRLRYRNRLFLMKTHVKGAEMKRHTLIAALVVVVCLWVGCSNAFAVTFKGTLDWQTSRAEAVALATAQGKKILLVAGRYPALLANGMDDRFCH